MLALEVFSVQALLSHGLLPPGFLSPGETEGTGGNSAAGAGGARPGSRWLQTRGKKW